ncbi:protein FAM50isoform 1-like [Tropilaelaps mercedesae]|uniref:Protein FAM50 homolog n=1 Tax=Tropilaelaps mercedesae TaxID=418985 RepID=A0A1V9Y127_9ACAR|nr:protein FAM50isoform 1-like [Tropilaelaps mercedesae]
MAQYKGAASEAGRAMQILKRRERQKEEVELKRQKIEQEMRVSMGDKFSSHFDAVEAQIKSATVGLVTLDEMKAKQEDAVKEREKRLAQKEKEKLEEKRRAEDKKRAQKEKQKKAIQALSFNFDDEVDEDEENQEGNDSDETGKKSTNDSAQEKFGSLTGEDNRKDGFDGKIDRVDDDDASSDSKRLIEDKGPKTLIREIRVKKNPDVDTSFLPDREREEAERMIREELRQEWKDKQKALKEENIQITFSYWDGSGHRRVVDMKKGNSIYQFLQRCLDALRKEFYELRVVSADQLMYIKEDLIIPHHYTFYDFIVTKARGKSGPLFAFDASEDIRMTSDASKEKEESHAGKVLLRSWYERNKHIFPASRWEPYDPTKCYDKYTIKDKKKNKDGSEKD